MKGAIITNGYYSSASSRNQAERMRAELSKLGAEVDIIKNASPIAVGEKTDYDFAVFFDKDINLAEILENGGVSVFNSSRSIERADDKIKSAILMEDNGIPIPETYPAPKRYFYTGADEEYLSKVGEKLGYPLIVKESKGSLGREVYLAESYEDLKSIDEKTANCDKLYQKFVEGSKGRSYRLIVIGRKYFCGMLLTNEKDFRSNAFEGGAGCAVDIGGEYIRVAERVAEVFGLDYCGVDMFTDTPTVIEVNSNAYFETVEKVTGKNVAERYASHIISSLEGKGCKNLLS